MAIFRRSLLAVLSFAAICAANSLATSAEPPKSLLIYIVDVEGGQATLFVTPAGESLLIDTGWDDNNGRDADRIVAAAKDAGLTKIDYVLITHYHQDHVGGAPQLAGRFSVGGFIDHGPNRETSDAKTAARTKDYQDLLATGKYKHVVVKPGDTLPIHGADFTIVSGDGNLLDKPLSGAGEANSNCQEAKQPPADHTENEHSLGLVMNFGKLRLVDLGDLPWAKEVELMCPTNKLGKADIYIATHHGLYYSGSPALVLGIAPRIAVMENSAKKGGSPSAWDIVHSSPGLETLWQLHWSEEGGAAHNSAPEFLANLAGPDTGNFFKITVNPDASFDVMNSRNHKAQHYGPGK